MGDFGTVLREIRQTRHMTQEEMGRLFGTSKQVISRYENGQNSPKIATVKEYAKKLGVPEERMLKTREEMRAMVTPQMLEEAHGDLEEAFEWAVMMGDIKIDMPKDKLDQEDYDVLEALHQNPRLGLLFKRSSKMTSEDVDFMILMADRILKERDGD